MSSCSVPAASSRARYKPVVGASTGKVFTRGRPSDLDHRDFRRTLKREKIPDGNLATDPAFMAPDSSNFRLQPTSAGVNAGNPEFTDRDGTRADMGVYAGPEAPN